jgi:hypothetical protein
MKLHKAGVVLLTERERELGHAISSSSYKIPLCAPRLSVSEPPPLSERTGYNDGGPLHEIITQQPAASSRERS